MTRAFLLSFGILLSAISGLKAQNIQPPPSVVNNPRPTGGIAPPQGAEQPGSIKELLGLKNEKYIHDEWKFIYAISLKDSSKINANSNILKDNATGKHFLIYTIKDSLIKIFPEQTIKIQKPNPYKLDELITGIPKDGHWRFQLTSGRINSWSSFASGNEPEEFQAEDGKLLPISSPQFEALMKANKWTYKAYLKRQYFEAIMLYNTY